MEYDMDDPQAEWPPGLRVLALTTEATQALGWAEAQALGGHTPLSEECLALCIGNMRRMLLALPKDAHGVVANALAFTLSIRSDSTTGKHRAATQALREAISCHLRADLRMPPRHAGEWAWRVGRIASHPWIGEEAWSAPAGWLPLLERGVAQADRWTDPRKREQAWRTRQMKEKLASLRWHCDGDDRLRTITDFAELASNATCQACGQEGRSRNHRGWIATLCEEHGAMHASGHGYAVRMLCYPSGGRPP